MKRRSKRGAAGRYVTVGGVLTLFGASLGVVQDIAIQVEGLQFSGAGRQKYSGAGEGAAVAHDRSWGLREA